MDTPDIARYLKHPNDGFKLQALVSLIQKLDKENNAATLRNNLEYLYEATQSSSAFIADSACSWISHTASAAAQLEDSQLSQTLRECFKDTKPIFTEIFSKLKKSHHPRFLGRLAFTLVNMQTEEDINDSNNMFGFFQVFLRIYELVSEATEETIAFSDLPPCNILRIIHYEKLPVDICDWLMTKALATFSNPQSLFECTSSKVNHRNIHLCASSIDSTTFFFDNLELFLKSSDIPLHSFNNNKFDVEVGSILLKSSLDCIKLIKDKGFIQPSPLLLIPLFVFIANFNQLNRCLPNEEAGKWLKDIMGVFKESQQSKSLAKVNVECFGTIAEWFSWIVANEKISTLLKQWKHLKEKDATHFDSYQSLIILFGFFPFVVDKDDECETLLDIVRLSCNETNENLIINFHICHFNSSPLSIKKTILRNFAKLKVNDFSTKQILRFCCSCSQSPDIAVHAYEAVATIFKRNDWIFFENEFQTMIDIPRTQESAASTESKFKLIKLACLTEAGEKLIKAVIGWIQSRPDLLAHAVECTTNLSTIEMIEIDKFRTMLKDRVHQAGNEAALKEYCQFLATSIIDFDEFDLAVSCAEELWELKNHQNPAVKSSAYQALSKFSKYHLPETLVEEQQNPTASPEFLFGEQVFQGIDENADKTTLGGFEKFLQKALQIDVEQLSRKFFVSQQSTTLDSLIGNETKKRFPSDYSKLPEKSVLRVAVEKARTTQNLHLCKTILNSIVDLKRSDSKVAFHIPPLDWTSLNFNERGNPEIHRSLFVIALQQTDLRLIYTFINDPSLLSAEDFPIMETKIAEAIINELSVITKIPSNSLVDIVEYIISMFASNGWKSSGEVPKALCEIAVNRVEICNVLSKHFGAFSSAAKLNTPFFRYFCQVKNVASLAEGKLAQFWIELMKRERADLGKLMNTLANMDPAERDEAFIITVSWLRSDYKEEFRLRLLKKLDQIAPHSHIPANQAFDMLAAIIISEKSDAFPLELLEENPKEQKRILLDFFSQKLKNTEWMEFSARILVNILNKEMEFDERKMALKCLRILLDKYPGISGSISTSLLNEMLI